jgi:hypothetical protein
MKRDGPVPDASRDIHRPCGAALTAGDGAGEPLGEGLGTRWSNGTCRSGNGGAFGSTSGATTTFAGSS